MRTLGRGGMGVVYEAYQQSMRRPVAIKLLEPTVSGSLDEVIRFEREAWIGGRLTHPNIVKVIERGQERGQHFLVMEYIDGGSLADRIQRFRDSPTGEPSVNTARILELSSLFAGVAGALDYIHSSGIVHRDIKRCRNGCALTFSWGMAHPGPDWCCGWSESLRPRRPASRWPSST